MTVKRVAVNAGKIDNEPDHIGFGAGDLSRALRTVEANAPIEDMIYRFLDTNGDGTGAKNANGDYSSTPTEFKIITPANEIFEIVRMIVAVRDTGALSADEYGSIGNALTNGIEVYVKNAEGDIVNDITDGVPITANACWARFCYDAKPDDYGSGDNFLTVRWTFAAAGSPLVLPVGYSFNVLCQDDLTGLSGGAAYHYFNVQGFKIRNQ